jgi:excisionase family DNA binding protein
MEIAIYANYAYYSKTAMTFSESDRRKVKAPRPASANRRDQFLTPTEVADRLLVAPVTVRLWASKGLLRSVTTPGGHRRFRTVDVEAFIAEHQQVHGSDEVAPSRILIIDDDVQFTRYLSILIATRAPGVLVDVAHDGFAAGIKCEAMRPDVVTLDLQMPEMNGYEVCSLLRSMFGKTKPRIVALTGLVTEENVQRILATGADACLAKNVGPDTLMDELGFLRARKR